MTGIVGAILWPSAFILLSRLISFFLFVEFTLDFSPIDSKVVGATFEDVLKRFYFGVSSNLLLESLDSEESSCMIDLSPSMKLLFFACFDIELKGTASRVLFWNLFMDSYKFQSSAKSIFSSSLEIPLHSEELSESPIAPSMLSFSRSYPIVVPSSPRV